MNRDTLFLSVEVFDDDEEYIRSRRPGYEARDGRGSLAKFTIYPGNAFAVYSRKVSRLFDGQTTIENDETRKSHGCIELRSSRWKLIFQAEERSDEELERNYKKSAARVSFPLSYPIMEHRGLCFNVEKRESRCLSSQNYWNMGKLCRILYCWWKFMMYRLEQKSWKGCSCFHRSFCCFSFSFVISNNFNLHYEIWKFMNFISNNANVYFWF